MAASELGAALFALMHHSKASNITTFNPEALKKLVDRCVDKVESNQSIANNLSAS